MTDDRPGPTPKAAENPEPSSSPAPAASRGPNFWQRLKGLLALRTVSLRDDLERRLGTPNPVYAYAGEEFHIYELAQLLNVAVPRLLDEAQVPLLMTRTGDQRAADGQRSLDRAGAGDCPSRAIAGGSGRNPRTFTGCRGAGGGAPPMVKELAHVV